MTVADAVLLVAAGMTAGLMNAVVGAGTLVTFPMLLFLGYPPVLANVSNTVGLVPGYVTATIGYRRTLVGQRAVVRRLVVATVIGGLTGGALLVVLPVAVFDAIVPGLLLLAALLAAVQPRVAAAIAARRASRAGGRATGVDRVGAGVSVSVLLAAVYGGYFGAGLGVIMLVILGLTLGGPLNELNGVKNILGGVANLVAALLFMGSTEVDWAVAGLIAVGATTGGALGGRYGRHLPSSVLRVLLVGIATVAAVTQLIG